LLAAEGGRTSFTLPPSPASTGAAIVVDIAMTMVRSNLGILPIPEFRP
jgi:hypothetical protein